MMPTRVRSGLRVAAAAALLAAATAVAAPAAAAPKNGCPAWNSDWRATTVVAAAATIYPALLDPSIFPGGVGDLEGALLGYDRNGDGDVCLLTMWGEALNPNSNWYRIGIEAIGSPTQQFFVKDNNANAD